MKPNSYNITEKDKELIRKYYKMGVTLQQLCTMFKVSKTRIKKILNQREDKSE